MSGHDTRRIEQRGEVLAPIYGAADNEAVATSLATSEQGGARRCQARHPAASDLGELQQSRVSAVGSGFETARDDSVFVGGECKSLEWASDGQHFTKGSACVVADSEPAWQPRET